MIKEINGRYLLGTGDFGWIPQERSFGRYGTVILEPQIDRARVNALCGLHGRLIARVIDIREHEHRGDSFLGIHPATPEINEEIVLGEGDFFIFDQGRMMAIGLKPEDTKITPWLDVKALYRAVDQYVELYFEEKRTQEPHYQTGGMNGQVETPNQANNV